MKVMCIKESKERFNIMTGDRLPLHGLIIGNIYTVIDDVFVSTLNQSMYELEEFKPDPKRQLFGKDLFAPLSDIDETELANKKEEVYA